MSASESEHRAAHGEIDKTPIETIIARSNPLAGINPQVLDRDDTGSGIGSQLRRLPLVRTMLDLMERARGRPVLGVAAVGKAGPPDQVGQWGASFQVPVIPIFTSLQPDGRILMWDTDGGLAPNPDGSQSSTRAAIWDPSKPIIPNGVNGIRKDLYGANLFCAGFSHLSNGTLFTAGGQIDVTNNGLNHTYVFDSRNDVWLRGPNMKFGRWYPSVASLPNDEHYIMGGGPDTHEVRRLNNTIQSLSGFFPQDYLYPFVQTAPNGKIAYMGPDPVLSYIGTAGAGSIEPQGPAPVDLIRTYGSYALYDVGKVLVAGGGTKSATLLELLPDTIKATVAADMTYSRRHHNLTVLADGSVLATGGLSSTAAQIDLANAVFAAELWNPITGLWTELSGAAFARQYHSVALLLPDGRVLTGGTGACALCTTFNYNRTDFEIFSPPYLFKQDGTGQLAPRASITSAPAAVGYGAAMVIGSAEAATISKVALVKLGAPTHAIDQGQRYVPLLFTKAAGTLSAVAPADGAIAPPGYYMLFLVDASGVPSVSKMVHVGPTAVDPPGLQATPGPPVVVAGPTPTPTPTAVDDGGGGGGGCTVGKTTDPMLMLLLLGAGAVLMRRRRLGITHPSTRRSSRTRG